jgi:hypothetical protein
LSVINISTSKFFCFEDLDVEVHAGEINWLLLNTLAELYESALV